MDCFFCDIQKGKDKKRIAKNQIFSARLDDFPVSKGHCEIFPKRHIVSFFGMNKKETAGLFKFISKVRDIVQKRYHPDGYNIGINEGRAAGRTMDHLHIHLIPRYAGDLKNPEGGIRNIFPRKGGYSAPLKKIPSRRKYLK